MAMVRLDASAQSGTTLIEILIAIVILALGLLGLAGLQTRLQVSEIEAYQRSQAIVLLQDMAGRLASNRTNAVDYITGPSAPIAGPSVTCPSAVSTAQQRDFRDWCLALQGASELLGPNSVGAMVGARGCIEQTGADYVITVTWQGMGPLSAPPGDVGCAAGLYNGGTGSPCVDDLCRRYVTTVVSFGTL